MKINLNQPFTDYKGEPIRENGSIKNVADTICQYLYVAGEGFTAEEKYDAFKLCMRIQADPENVELSTSEGNLIKRTCDKMLVAGAYGQIANLIDTTV